MKFPYSDKLFPPALLLPALVRDLDSPDVAEEEAKVDTGADITVISENVRAKLNLRPIGQRRCRGALDENSRRVPTYFVELSLDRKVFVELEVLARPRSGILLGRDVLNDWVLLANGPEEIFEISVQTGHDQ